MCEPPELVPDRRVDLRRAVSVHRHPQRRDAVDVPPALRVEEVGPLPPHDDEGVGPLPHLRERVPDVGAVEPLPPRDRVLEPRGVIHEHGAEVQRGLQRGGERVRVPLATRGDPRHGPEDAHAGEALQGGGVRRLGDPRRPRLRPDEDHPGHPQPPGPRRLHRERRVVEGPESGPRDDEEREPQVRREVRHGESPADGHEEPAHALHHEETVPRGERLEGAAYRRPVDGDPLPVRRHGGGEVLPQAQRGEEFEGVVAPRGLPEELRVLVRRHARGRGLHHPHVDPAPPEEAGEPRGDDGLPDARVRPRDEDAASLDSRARRCAKF